MNFTPWEPKVKKMPFFETVDKYIARIEEIAPEGFKGNVVKSGRGWSFMPSEDSFVSNALSGIAYALSFAFLIVLFTTGNIINTVIAIFCVGTVILSITASL
jgi:hypothetical protein